MIETTPEQLANLAEYCDSGCERKPTTPEPPVGGPEPLLLCPAISEGGMQEVVRTPKPDGWVLVDGIGYKWEYTYTPCDFTGSRAYIADAKARCAANDPRTTGRLFRPLPCRLELMPEADQ